MYILHMWEILWERSNSKQWFRTLACTAFSTKNLSGEMTGKAVLGFTGA